MLTAVMVAADRTGTLIDALFAASFDAVFLVDGARQVRRWSSAAQRLYGWRGEESV